MNDRQAWFVEGLRRLAVNLKDIAFHHVASTFEGRKAIQQGVEITNITSLPDHKEWCKFREEITDELRAAVKVGLEEHDTDLASCRELYIELKQGFYKDGSPLVFKAICEASMIADKLDTTAIDIVAYVDKLFSKCKGSHKDKGEAMGGKLTDEQWNAYKVARVGRPITKTIEQHFEQRSKDAAKKPN